MVEGSTTPKDKLLKLQGKTIVQTGSQQNLLLREPGAGERGRVSLPGPLLVPSQCHLGNCMLLGHHENSNWRMTCFSYFENVNNVLVPALLRTLDSITLISTKLFFFFNIIIISHHFSCVLWTATGVVFGYCSKCLQDPTIIY